MSDYGFSRRTALDDLLLWSFGLLIWDDVQNLKLIIHRLRKSYAYERGGSRHWLFSTNCACIVWQIHLWFLTLCKSAVNGLDNLWNLDYRSRNVWLIGYSKLYGRMFLPLLALDCKVGRLPYLSYLAVQRWTGWADRYGARWWYVATAAWLFR